MQAATAFCRVVYILSQKKEINLVCGAGALKMPSKIQLNFFRFLFGELNRQ